MPNRQAASIVVMPLPNSASAIGNLVMICQDENCFHFIPPASFLLHNCSLLDEFCGAYQ
jgi:hypothetical protein